MRAAKRRSTVGGPPKFKIVLLGEQGVGKSSLFMRLKDDVFGPDVQPTAGIESCSKLVDIDGDQIVVSIIWENKNKLLINNLLHFHFYFYFVPLASKFQNKIS